MSKYRLSPRQLCSLTITWQPLAQQLDTRLCQTYRLATARQLHSSVLLFIVLPECRLEGLQQACIVASQSFDIWIIVQRPIFETTGLVVTHQPQHSRAAYVSSSLGCVERSILPTSPGGADSTNEATVACFEAIANVIGLVFECLEQEKHSPQWYGGMLEVMLLVWGCGRSGGLCA